ncbi:conserved hypothetical protein [Leishmania major strain Friedlin]|uniref:Transmembrane protein n=1 Tax=Leishmania major TaxID=5664 RepID=Q4Q815_LEIMA|nr:conserved hypothetical protein [Leishmania major strain Friedlin]CAG9577363.1 hypothetical_protein_-_conserved [Leishmania major strain Friedlin]CAJ05705.1 conserved hypothetical protein [Leishmania major strain Friedlin]|eukprot:XP_001684533.1 conserved hypothetical protein [Leishmania major strain Friedlin]
MTRRSKFVRAASAGVALTMIVMATLCCTSAVCVPATARTNFENGRRFAAIPEIPAVVKQIWSVPPASDEGAGSPLHVMVSAPSKYELAGQEYPPNSASRIECTLPLVVERVHKDADHAHASSPGVVAMDTAAIAPADQPHIMPAALPAQLLRSPLANGEAAPTLKPLSKTLSLLPIHQRKQLVSPSYRAAGQLAAHQGGQKAAVEVAPAAVTANASSSGSSEGSSSREDNHGVILSSGVIASFTVAFIFAGLLLILVLAEACAMVSAFMAHRRMRAARDVEGADNPIEPKCADFRDTAVDV